MKTVTPEDSYLDTSFLFKFYLPESESEAALVWLKTRRGEILISGLSDVELITAFSRESSSADGYRAIGNYREDCLQGLYRKLEIDEEVFTRAIEVAERYSARYKLRSLDILHIATALRYGVTAIGTFDKRLAEGAGAVGLRVFP